MPTIEISQRTFARLQELAEPLVDNADTLIGRLLAMYDATGEHPVNGAGRKRQTGKTPHGRRARKGEKTSDEEFSEAVLKVLRAAGGELRTGDAIDRVGEVMADELNEVDRAELSSGEIRWRNTVRWAYHQLRKTGKVAQDAPYGIWRLNEKNSEREER